MRLAAAVLAVSLLAGCSALSAINPFAGGKPGIEANVNAGKNVAQEKSTVKVQQGASQTADSISNDSHVVADRVQQVTQQMPPWMFLVVVLLAGWAIPSPGACFRGLRRLFQRKQ